MLTPPGLICVLQAYQCREIADSEDWYTLRRAVVLSWPSSPTDLALLRRYKHPSTAVVTALLAAGQDLDLSLRARSAFMIHLLPHITSLSTLRDPDLIQLCRSLWYLGFRSDKDPYAARACVEFADVILNTACLGERNPTVATYVFRLVASDRKMIGYVCMNFELLIFLERLIFSNLAERIRRMGHRQLRAELAVLGYPYEVVSFSEYSYATLFLDVTPHLTLIDHLVEQHQHQPQQHQEPDALPTPAAPPAPNSSPLQFLLEHALAPTPPS
eukprot:Sspe_Gene.38379::Locus_18499_Transcript_1_1_Confidence_1.000_Length_2258::g.38379::m.38379